MDKNKQLTLVNPVKPGKLLKKVSFFRSCSVILIPCNEEYKQAGINLWFTDKEFDIQKEDTKKELQEFMQNNADITTAREALRALYQPSTTSPSAVYDIQSLDAPILVRGASVFG